MTRILIVAFVCGLISASAAQSAPRQAVDAPETASGNPDKIVCKRFVRIGSLVDGYRTCKTKKEWERERENLRQVNMTDSCRTRGSGGPVTPIPGSPGTYDC
jgi:hypothetical protein